MRAGHQAGEAGGKVRQRDGVGGNAAAIDGGRAGIDAGDVGERRGHRLLRRVARALVTVGVEAHVAGDADHAGVLAGAVVVEAAIADAVADERAGGLGGERRVAATGEIPSPRPAAASIFATVATWRGSPECEAQASASSAGPKP